MTAPPRRRRTTPVTAAALAGLLLVTLAASVPVPTVDQPLRALLTGSPGPNPAVSTPRQSVGRVQRLATDSLSVDHRRPDALAARASAVLTRPVDSSDVAGRSGRPSGVNGGTYRVAPANPRSGAETRAADSVSMRAREMRTLRERGRDSVGGIIRARRTGSAPTSGAVFRAAQQPPLPTNPK